MSDYGTGPLTSSVRRLSVAPAMLTIGRGLLEGCKCPCGRDARRVTLEYRPLVQDWRKARKAPETLAVLTWCGETEGHTGDGPVDPDDIALDEGDL